jgi:ribosomal protein L11 methyltransferase
MLDFILEITCPPELEDEVQARLFPSACTGSSSEVKPEAVIISAYFESAPDRAAAVEALDVLKVRIRTLERGREDWLLHYQQSLKALEIGRRFVVAPDSSLIKTTDRLPIIIPQEHAFGTGSHETTALCLEMLENSGISGATALDAGSGSGVLAIAMHLLGARRVVAFDNDPEALPVLRTNLERNSCANGDVLSYCGTLDALGPSLKADAVVMNILPEVILPMLAPLKTFLHRGSMVILSGVLIERSAEVTGAALREGYQPTHEKTKGEWWCGAFRL